MTHDEAQGGNQPLTIRTLARKLRVPMSSVVKALMHLGLMRTADQPLTADEVELATKLIVDTPDDFSDGTTGRIPPKPGPNRPPRRPPGGAPVREPRNPPPPGPSEAGAAPPDD